MGKEPAGAGAGSRPSTFLPGQVAPRAPGGSAVLTALSSDMQPTHPPLWTQGCLTRTLISTLAWPSSAQLFLTKVTKAGDTGFSTTCPALGPLPDLGGGRGPGTGAWDLLCSSCGTCHCPQARRSLLPAKVGALSGGSGTASRKQKRAVHGPSRVGLGAWPPPLQAKEVSTAEWPDGWEPGRPLQAWCPQGAAVGRPDFHPHTWGAPLTWRWAPAPKCQVTPTLSLGEKDRPGPATGGKADSLLRLLFSAQTVEWTAVSPADTLPTPSRTP